MESAVDEHCFSQPHWRVIAQGFNTETWFNEDKAVGSGGILMPKPLRLHFIQGNSIIDRI